MNKFYLTVLLLLVFNLAVKAQSPTNLSGSVSSLNASAIEGANIYLLNTNFHTVTNGKGIFQLKNIPAGKYQLQVSAVGYATLLREVEVNENMPALSLQLTDANLKLDEVVVSAQKSEEEALLPHSRHSKLRMTACGLSKILPHWCLTCMLQTPVITVT